MTKKDKKKRNVKQIPAKSPKQRENQLINLAVDLAERQLRDGSATSQVITHFLKLATTREQLENERLRAELKLSSAKVKHLESQNTSQELYEKALAAFKSYSVGGFQEEGEIDDDE